MTDYGKVLHWKGVYTNYFIYLGKEEQSKLNNLQGVSANEREGNKSLPQ